MNIRCHSMREEPCGAAHKANDSNFDQERSASGNQRTRKPTALDYSVEDGGSAYKYSDYKDREQEYNLLFDHFIVVHTPGWLRCRSLRSRRGYHRAWISTCAEERPC